VGSGEKLDEIEPFHPDRMASRILGMGDVLTLIEKAEAAIDQKKAQELEQRLRENRFTLQDFYDQLVQIRDMGGMQDMLAMMPGAGQLKNVQLDEKALARTEAIILSMTPAERENPSILNHSRKQRIAAGAGVKAEDINRLLKQFTQMQQLVKQFSGAGGKRKMKGLAGRFGGMQIPGMPGM
jgi:signal recognition particle subunit SRP54